LPFDPEVVAGGDRGNPVLNGGADTPFVRAVWEFVEAVLKNLGETVEGI